jgi:hypothetical protein
MSTLNPAKLHVACAGDTGPTGPLSPRRYTLTHSDRTGDLFLTIGQDYDRRQISGLYTRFMRDEVLAEWQEGEAGPELHVHCHVSGGLVAGTAAWRYDIFQSHMRQVLQAFRHGDSALFAAHPELARAPVRVHFHASQAQYDKIEDWGMAGDYRLVPAS